MDRRDFLKTFLSTSLLTPVLLASKGAAHELELYIISSDLTSCLPRLLQEASGLYPARARTFSFLGSHPQRPALSRLLEDRGWTLSGDPQQADIAISFSRIQAPARESFTVVKKGEILDVRQWGLLDLWKEMGQKAPARGLTTLAFRRADARMHPGERVIVYSQGRKTASLSLERPSRLVFDLPSGKVVVRIENNSARVEESSCRHKICTHSLPVTSVGERIICAPNHFMLKVSGPGSIDTVIG